MSEPADAESEFLALVAARQTADPDLTAIQAGMLVGAQLGVAQDSRSFANLLGLPHALVLRDLNLLLERGDKLQLVKRDPRTSRVHFRLVG